MSINCFKCGQEFKEVEEVTVKKLQDEIVEKDRRYEELQEKYDTLHDQRHEEARKADDARAELQKAKERIVELEISVKGVHSGPKPTPPQEERK